MANFWENMKDPRNLAGMSYGKNAAGDALYPEYSGGDLGNMAQMTGHELLNQDRSVNGNNPSIQNIQHRLGVSPIWSKVIFENLPAPFGGNTDHYTSGRTETQIDPRGSSEHVRETIDHELGHAKEMLQGTDPHLLDDPNFVKSASNTGVHFATDTPGQMFNRSGKRGLELMIQRLNSNPWGNLPK